MNLRTAFIQNLKFYRKKQKLSQMMLAECCKTSPSYIGEIEIGKKFPSIEMVETLAEALQVQPHLLFINPEEESESVEKRSLIPESVKTRITAELISAIKKTVEHL